MTDEQTETTTPESFTSLNVEMRRQPDQGRWVFGVNVNGAFIPFASAKLGGIDDELREASEPGFRAARAKAYREEILGL